MKRVIKFLLSAILFVILMGTMLAFSEGPAVTSNFETGAPNFHVLGVKNGNYETLLLKDVLDGQEAYRFRLQESEYKLAAGGDDKVEVLQSTPDKQRIRYFYSNTYMSESIYDVEGNTVTPVEYRLLGSIGHFGLYLLFLAVALAVAPLLAELLIKQWSKRYQSDSQSEGDDNGAT